MVTVKRAEVQTKSEPRIVRLAPGIPGRHHSDPGPTLLEARARVQEQSKRAEPGGESLVWYYATAPVRIWLMEELGAQRGGISEPDIQANPGTKALLPLWLGGGVNGLVRYRPRPHGPIEGIPFARFRFATIQEYELRELGGARSTLPRLWRDCPLAVIVKIADLARSGAIGANLRFPRRPEGDLLDYQPSMKFEHFLTPLEQGLFLDWCQKNNLWGRQPKAPVLRTRAALKST
jgi:hypothetical protein